MRRSAYWMEQLDERILEHLEEVDWSTPDLMAQEDGFSASAGRIEERCKMLQYAGMVAPMYDDMYEITTDGQLYLQEEIDANYRPWPTVDRVLRS